MFTPTPKGQSSKKSATSKHSSNGNGSHSAAQDSEQQVQRSTTTARVGGPVAPSPATAPPPTASTASMQRTQQQRQVQALSQVTQQATTELNDIRERRNWLIHVLYTRQEFINCLSVIEAQLRDTEGTCEYALYVKGLLKRMEGCLTESLALLQAAVLVSPENIEARKQFGRALFLLGRHEEALEAYRESQALAMARGRSDWEVELHLGLCLVFLGDLEGAVSAFVRSLGLQRIDSTFLHLGRTLVQMKSYSGAIQIYEEALAMSPNNADLLVALGQLHLQERSEQKAFQYFGACLAEDPSHLKAIVGAMSIVQAKGDYETALVKYRIAVTKAPDSPQLWNNIGVCFYARQASEVGVDTARGETTKASNLYAAVACLRKAIILAPFEWVTNYNLGLTFLALGRSVSAFHYLSAAISLNDKYAPAYVYLAVCLSLMNDVDNAVRAYERALRLDDDVVGRVNYAITLMNCNLLPESAAQLQLVLPKLESTSLEQLKAYSPRLPDTLSCLKSALAGVHPGHTQQQQQQGAGGTAPLTLSVTQANDDNAQNTSPKRELDSTAARPPSFADALDPGVTALSSVPVFRRPRDTATGESGGGDGDGHAHDDGEGHTSGGGGANPYEYGDAGDGGDLGGAAAAARTTVGESSTLHAYHSPSMTLASTSITEEATNGDGITPRGGRGESSQNQQNEDDLVLRESAGDEGGRVASLSSEGEKGVGQD